MNINIGTEQLGMQIWFRTLCDLIGLELMVWFMLATIITPNMHISSKNCVLCRRNVCMYVCIPTLMVESDNGIHLA